MVSEASAHLDADWGGQVGFADDEGRSGGSCICRGLMDGLDKISFGSFLNMGPLRIRKWLFLFDASLLLP